MTEGMGKNGVGFSNLHYYITLDLNYQLLPIDRDVECLLMKIIAGICEYLVSCVYNSASRPQQDFTTNLEHLILACGSNKLPCFGIGHIGLDFKNGKAVVRKISETLHVVGNS